MKVCAGQALPELWGHERGGDTMAVRARRATRSLGRGTVLPNSPLPRGWQWRQPPPHILAPNGMLSLREGTWT